MVGMPGFWAGFLALVDRTGGGRGGGGPAGEKYSFTVFRDREIQFYSSILILTVEITNPNSREFES